jgi:hypothetical protein
MKRVYEMCPGSPGARLKSQERARRQALQRRRQAQIDAEDRAGRMALAAEAGARHTTRWLLGADLAARIAWEGHADGTASGWVDGCNLGWERSALDRAGRLTLHGRCWVCGARWTTPVLSKRQLSNGQLITAVVEDRCGCVRRTRSAPIEELAG